jgi:peptidoglycan/xylan/chitin deacetylase (PgdA/CDA1 family)
MNGDGNAAQLRRRWLASWSILSIAFGLSAWQVDAAPATPAFVTSCYSSSGSLTNANFETASGNQAVGWCDSGLGYMRALVTPAKYNYVAQLRVATSVPADQRIASAYQTVQINQTQPNNIFVGGMVKGSVIVIDPDGVGVTMNVAFHVDCAAHPDFCKYVPDGTVLCTTLPSEGTFDWRWIGVDSHTCGVGFRDATGHWVDVPIASLDVVVLLAGATGTAWFDLMQLSQYGAGRGAVTFMFDDGNKSTASEALPILKSYGFPGSAAIISSHVGRTGSVTALDLKNLQAAGWDITSHSVTHPSMTAISTSAATTELLNSKSFLESLGLTIDTFVWPKGDYSQTLIGLAQTPGSPAPLYASTRGTEWGDNANGTHPYLLKTLALEGWTTLSHVQAWIRDLKDDPNCSYPQHCNGRWGILVGHDINKNPDPVDDPNDITPDFLGQVANAVSMSGLDVINYRTGYQRFAHVPRP